MAISTEQKRLEAIKATTLRTINRDINNKTTTAILSLYFLEESIDYLNVFLGIGYTQEKSNKAIKEIKRLERLLKTLITKHF